jgi:hypothetical protein
VAKASTGGGQAGRGSIIARAHPLQTLQGASSVRVPRCAHHCCVSHGALPVCDVATTETLPRTTRIVHKSSGSPAGARTTAAPMFNRERIRTHARVVVLCQCVWSQLCDHMDILGMLTCLRMQTALQAAGLGVQAVALQLPLLLLQLLPVQHTSATSSSSMNYQV